MPPILPCDRTASILRAGAATSAPLKPRLRGVSHLLAACLAAPAVLLLWAGAGSYGARLGAAVYGLSLITLFATSAIFLLIAGTYTPFGLRLGPGTGYILLGFIWGGALCGVALSLAWPEAPKKLMAAIYVAFGWSFAILVPSLFRVAGPMVIGLILLGAIAYTVGAVVYARRRPDPFPRIFGYHEVFHLLVIAAAACHFAAVSLTLPALI